MTPPIRPESDNPRLNNLRKIAEGYRAQGATADEIAELIRTYHPELQAQAPEPMGALDKVRGGLQAGLQGATFNFADEIVAGGRALASRIPGGDEPISFDDALADERASLGQFREANPKTALGLELGGGLLSGLGAAGLAARGATGLNAAARIAASGAGGGALAGAGAGETMGGRAAGAVGYGAAGGLLGAGLGKLANSRVGDYVRREGGDLLEALTQAADGPASYGVPRGTGQVANAIPEGFNQSAGRIVAKSLGDKTGKMDAARDVLAELEAAGMGNDVLALNLGGDPAARSARALANVPSLPFARTNAKGVLDEALARQGGALGAAVADDIGVATGMGGTPGPIRLAQMQDELSGKVRGAYQAFEGRGDLGGSGWRPAFHGTYADDIAEFDRMGGSAARSGNVGFDATGPWFSSVPDKAGAGKYGPNVLTREIRLQNPLVIDYPAAKVSQGPSFTDADNARLTQLGQKMGDVGKRGMTPQEVAEITELQGRFRASKMAGNKAAAADPVADLWDAYHASEFFQRRAADPAIASTTQALRSKNKMFGDVEGFREWLKSQGYDGLEIRGFTGDGGAQDVFVPLENSQIRRSAMSGLIGDQNTANEFSRYINTVRKNPELARLPETDARVINEAFHLLQEDVRQAGRGTSAVRSRTLRELRDRVLDAIGEVDPAYKQVTRDYALDDEVGKVVQGAFEKGMGLPSKPVGTGTVALEETTDAGREAMRAGFATDLQRRAGEAASNPDLAEMAKFRDAARVPVANIDDAARFKEMFGEDAYKTLLGRLSPKIRAAAMNAAVRGNSSTARQLLDAMQLGDNAVLEVLESGARGGAMAMGRNIASMAYQPLRALATGQVGQTAEDAARLFATRGAAENRSLLDVLEQIGQADVARSKAVQPVAGALVGRYNGPR